MVNQDQINTMMRNCPPEAELLQMPPEDLGMHLLKYMTRAYAATNGSTSCRWFRVAKSSSVLWRLGPGWCAKGFLHMLRTT
jgi:hypothetical protein